MLIPFKSYFKALKNLLLEQSFNENKRASQKQTDFGTEYDCQCINICKVRGNWSPGSSVG